VTTQFYQNVPFTAVQRLVRSSGCTAPWCKIGCLSRLAYSLFNAHGAATEPGFLRCSLEKQILAFRRQLLKTHLLYSVFGHLVLVADLL